MTSGITGLTYCYNALERDYCLSETIQSLLMVCDEVIVVDCGSTDGTREMVSTFPRVRIIDHDFDLKTQGPRWLWRCIQAGRMAAKTAYVLQLDADEVLHQADNDVLKEHVWSGRPAWCHRLNFWKDGRTELIEGRVVGTQVVRLAPQYYYLPSDEPHVPEPPVRVDAIQLAQEGRKIRIFHYGMIRRLDAFVIKSRAMTEGYSGVADPRLDAFETRGKEAFDDFVSPSDTKPYTGDHPQVAMKWLQERNLL